MRRAVLMVIMIVLMPQFNNQVSGNSSTDDLDTDPKHNLALAFYNQLNSPDLQYDVFEMALKGYRYFTENNKLKNDSILTIVDFSKPSSEKRLYVINIKSRTMVLHTWVAHGRNTGMLMAEKFSNTPNAYQSSLGFYLTDMPYVGSNGYSLKLDGMEEGINHNARARAIVIHGADYVSESFLTQNGRLGRSHGCPAVPMQENKMLIDLIKDKSCLFIYHPTNDYFAQSKILGKTAV
jgi:hypothetical protein